MPGLLGLLAKQMLVTAPFVLLLLDYWPLRRLDRRAWLEKLPMFALVAVFCAVVQLAHNFGLGVVSEGVDRHGQLAQLQAIDCEFGQGYLFSKPLSGDKAIEFLREQNGKVDLPKAA